MTLQKKLFGFVVSIIGILFFALGAGYYFYNSIQHAGKLKDSVNTVVKKANACRLAEKTYLQFFDESMHNTFIATAAQVGECLKKLNSANQNQARKEKIALISSEFTGYTALFDAAVTNHNNHSQIKKQLSLPLQTALDQLDQMNKSLDAEQSQKQMEGDDLSQDQRDMLSVLRDCRIAFLQLQNLQNQFLATGDEKYIEQFRQVSSGNVQTYMTSLSEFAKALKNENFQTSSIKIQSSLNEFLGGIQKSLDFGAKANELVKKLDVSGETIFAIAEEILTEADQFVEQQKAKALNIIGVFIIISISLAIVLSWLIIRSITRTLSSNMNTLKNGVARVIDTASQIAQFSNVLNSDTVRQTDSLQNTANVLKQIFSMTLQDTQNVKNADKLMKDTNVIVQHANQSMCELSESMDVITKASEETAKIIKTIDEIAFQTNLLALNAAVEAARAGESGKSFAVVAGEVRSLAQRAAEAADNTAGLLENTTVKIRNGGQIANRTNESFNGVGNGAAKVAELLNQISSSAHEQNDRISQLDQTIKEMEKTNAQHAQQASHFSEVSDDMSQQAQQMKQAVKDMLALIGGAAQKNTF